jgi:membrane associated rhomboid family serine protease
MSTVIPLSDESRRVTHFALVTVSIIAINVIVSASELMRGEPFVLKWAFVPANLVAGHGWITILTAMFMHGGWVHIIST